MTTWTNPEPLTKYKLAQRSPGLYVIGCSANSLAPPTSSQDSDPYLLEHWPVNFRPEYVGISEANAPGVRGRLSCHARSKGSKHIKNLLGNNINLYFIAIYGVDASSYEALFIALKTKSQFVGNVRLEFDRAALKEFRKVRALMSDFEREYYDNLEVDGDGM